MPYRDVEFRAGEYYHLYNRGNNFQPIFFDRENYLYFLRQVRKYLLLETVEIVAYYLMPNHYHLLAHLKTDDLSGPMQRFALSYTKAINKRYERVGSLFQGRFKAVHVGRNEYLLHLCPISGFMKIPSHSEQKTGFYTAMKALILAAGQGTRLRPLTLDRPKPMLPIGGKPLLEHLVTWLRRHGITDIAINLHYKPEAITDYFGDGGRFGVSITYSFEEQPLGTAGAAKKLQSFFDDTFVVVYGDVFTNLDLTRLIAFHNAQKGSKGAERPFSPAPWLPCSLAPCLTLALYRVQNPTECGLVELDGNGCVVRFVEKPPPDQVFTDLANAGVLVVEPGILDHIPPDIFYDFGHDLFPRLMNQGIPLYGHILRDDEFLIDIGTPAAFQRAQDVAYR